MKDLSELLRPLRSEDSKPLEAALQEALTEATNPRSSRMAIQIESNLVTKGISLVVHFASATAVTIFLSNGKFRAISH